MNLSSGAAEPIPKSVPHQFEYHVSGRGGGRAYTCKVATLAMMTQLFVLKMRLCLLVLAGLLLVDGKLYKLKFI